MENHLRFESLLIEISANFVSLPAERIDDAIRDAQIRVCEFLELDRSSLWRIIENIPDNLMMTHVYQSPEFETRLPVGPFNADDHFPWIFDTIKRGETA